MSDRPNILFVMTDQHRGSSLGADPNCPTDSDGRPLIHTPNLDSFVSRGVLFERCYSPVPSSIPARRCLLTGQTPYTNDCTGWKDEEPWEFEHTLPGELTEAGYQTHLAGKIHSIPNRNACGFESMDQHEGLWGFPDDDYTQWLKCESDGLFGELSHGLGRNSWDPRPWHLPEQYHPTNWTTERALDFLRERDPTGPFFLNLSYVRPHTPLDPPRPYWDMYIDRELPEPYMGEWAGERYGEKLPDYPDTDAWLADLPPTTVRRARAAYYGSITHIDHQLKRVLDALRKRDELENTFVLFAADHGEMLGDHYHWRKTYPFEGSARVPMLLRFPDGWRPDLPRKRLIDRPVGLEDVMPTLLSVAGVPVPETVEGRDLLALVADPEREWRGTYHGESTPNMYDPENTMQYLVGERFKYVYYPTTGTELLFDLASDPGETVDLSDDPDYESTLAAYRDKMVGWLADRPEGFVADGDLTTVDSGSLTPDGVSLESK